MKIKKLNLKENIIPNILYGSVILATISGSIIYYNYENKEQILNNEIDSNKIFIDSDGKIKCYFDAYEHMIKVSRNDAYYHKSEEIEGYTIKEVEINGWRDNNTITYVNTEAVIVTATNEDNKLEFNDFGKIVSKKALSYYGRILYIETIFTIFKRRI